MKTFARTFALVCLLFGSVTFVQGVQITFRVNLSSQIALGNFNPASDSAVVAGDPINSWSTSASPLASSAADTNVWVGTFDLQATPGATGQYKFVMNTSKGTVWENQVGSGGATGNRTFTIPTTNEVLPVVYFNNVTNSTSVTNQITFRVNMAVQIALGNFDPASGTLSIGGEFNSWSASASLLTNSVTDTNLWITTLSLAGANASAVNYKYVMNGMWEGNVGPGGAQNRSLTLARTNQTLPVVYFNNVTNVPVPTPLVFQVNLAAQTALGNFNPSTDTVEARGTFNNWSAGFGLTNGSTNPYLFSGTWVDSSDAVGGTIQYQFVLNGNTWETTVGNRMYTILSTNQQTLPLVFFNNVSNLGTLSLRATNGQATLAWTAGPLIRLQSATAPLSPWQDLPNTQGSNSLTLPFGTGPKFFRLIGP